MIEPLVPQSVGCSGDFPLAPLPSVTDGPELLEQTVVAVGLDIRFP